MSEDLRTPMPAWTALAQRSGDSAFGRKKPVECSDRVVGAKAAWRFASRCSPKPSASRRRVYSKYFAGSPYDSSLPSFE